jgi:hypothetical protein
MDSFHFFYSFIYNIEESVYVTNKTQILDQQSYLYCIQQHGKTRIASLN